MATKAFWFPSQTGSYSVKAGDVRLKIWYDYASDVNTDTNARIKKIGALKIPLEVTPSSNQFRFGSISIDFENTANIFETQSIVVESKRKETYLDIYIDGSLYWRGVIDFANISRKEYYDDSGSLKYESIVIPWFDALYSLKLNDKTLSDASYSDEMSLETLIKNIAALIGFGSAAVNIDANIKISEACGNDYDISDFYITGQSNSDLAVDFLKKCILYLGCFIYILGGKFNVISRIGGSTQSVTVSEVRSVIKKSNPDYITYVKTSTVFITADKNLATSLDYASVTETIENGAEDVNESRNVVLADDDFLEYIFTDASGYGADYYPIPDEVVDDGDLTTLKDYDETFLTANIETGDIVRASAGNDANSIINAVVNEYRLEFYTAAFDCTGMYYYIAIGNNATDNFRYKFTLLTQKVAAVLNEFYRTSPDIYNVRFCGLSIYGDISKRFIFYGNNHRARNAVIDILTDKISMELVEVT